MPQREADEARRLYERMARLFSDKSIDMLVDRTASTISEETLEERHRQKVTVMGHITGGYGLLRSITGKRTSKELGITPLDAEQLARLVLDLVPEHYQGLLTDIHHESFRQAFAGTPAHVIANNLNVSPSQVKTAQNKVIKLIKVQKPHRHLVRDEDNTLSFE